MTIKIIDMSIAKLQIAQSSHDARNIYIYCQTHGGCAYDSSVCMTKASGHKNEATFEKKLRGSKGFCDLLLEPDDDYVTKQHRIKKIKEKKI